MRFLTAVSLILGAVMLCLLPLVLSRRDSVTWFACITAERDIVYFSETGQALYRVPGDFLEATWTDSHVLVVTQENSRWQFTRMQLDGSHRVLLAETGTRVTSRPAWSAHGIVFAGENPAIHARDLYLLNHDRLLLLLTDTNIDHAPSWSPDGEWLVFLREQQGIYDIFKIRADGTGLQNLTNSPEFDTQPIWLGEWIVFVSRRNDNVDIFKMRPDGSDPRQLTGAPAEEFSPVASPDGTRIAYFSHQDRVLTLKTMQNDGSDVQYILNMSVDQFWGSLAWLPAPDAEFQPWKLVLGSLLLAGFYVQYLRRFRLGL